MSEVDFGLEMMSWGDGNAAVGARPGVSGFGVVFVWFQYQDDGGLVE